MPNAMFLSPARQGTVSCQACPVSPFWRNLIPTNSKCSLSACRHLERGANEARDRLEK